MAGTINTFNKGMNKDISKQKYPSQNYVDAKNIRPVTDEGLSTGAVENVAGNKFIASFPNIAGMYVITPDVLFIEAAANNYITSFQVNTTSPSISSVSPTDVSISTASQIILDIYNILNIERNRALLANVPEELTFKIGYLPNVNRIVVYSPNNTITNIQGDGFILEKYLDAENFIIIGSEEMRNDIVLFTKNILGNKNFGQIWKFSYDVARPQDYNLYKTELIFHGDLEFSLEHPIEAVTRYENRETVKTYFTDNNKELRTCNILDPTTFAYRAIDFSVSPKGILTPAVGSTKDHTGGKLLSGIWYVTYRLSKQGQGLSTTAPFSAGIPIIVDDPGAGINGGDTEYGTTNYASQIVPASKAIDFIIRDVPPGFSNILIYVVHEVEPSNFQSYFYGENIIVNNESYTFTISDISDKESIPFTSLITNDVNFDRVKTLAVKDNSLLLGNVKVGQFNLEYDARAYGFLAGSSRTYIGQSTSHAAYNPNFIETFQLDPSQESDPNWLIPEKADVLNPYNDDKFQYDYTRDSTGNTIVDGFQVLQFNYQKYDPNASGVLKRGGTGPNISYEFITQDFILDDANVAVPNTSRGFGTIDTKNSNTQSPYVNNLAKEEVIFPITGVDTDIGPGFSNFKNPTFEAYFKGYMRDEVYRFGIVFYSDTGAPSEVKWIADIRFPSAGDTDANFLANGLSEDNEAPFSMAQWSVNDSLNHLQGAGNPQIRNTDNNDKTIGKTLGIKFTVNISSIKDKIAGYSIVRSPRRQKDRSIIAEGIQHHVDAYTQDQHIKEKTQASWKQNLDTTANSNSNDYGDFRDKNNISSGILNTDWAWKPRTMKWKGSDWFTNNDPDVSPEFKYNNLHIRDGIIRATDQWRAFYHTQDSIASSAGVFANANVRSYAINPENLYGRTIWGINTYDCPDLKVQSGATIQGYKENNKPTDNSWNQGSEKQDYYMIKPVSFYSCLYEKGTSAEDILEFARTGGAGVRGGTNIGGTTITESSIQQNPIQMLQSLDHVVKAVVLRGSSTTLSRNKMAWEKGTLSDIFTVDHNNGGADYEEFTYTNNHNLDSDTYRFRNAGILGLVANDFPIQGETQPSDPALELMPTFDGVGVRTLLTVGHNDDIGIQTYNSAKSITLSRFPFGSDTGGAATGYSGTNYFDFWGYYGTFGEIGNRKLGHYMICDIYKYNPDRYGGSTYTERSNSEYISCNNFINTTNNASNIISSENVFGGDIVVSLYTEKKFYSTHNITNVPDSQTTVSPYTFNPDYGQVPTNPLEEPLRYSPNQDISLANLYTRLPYGTTRGICYPVQTVVNHELRPLTHLNNQTSEFVSPPDQRNFRKGPDEYATPILYHREKTTQTYVTQGASSLIAEYDNRIYQSNVKANGESSDSWAIVEAQNYIDVDAEYGPINKITILNDQTIFFQDKAIGILAVNPRSVIPGPGGSDLQLGLSPGLVDFNYVSNTVGAFHQWGIRKGQRGIYFFDSVHKKFMYFAGGAQPLSDLKGMSSWFYNELFGELLSKDNPILFEGLTTAYDHRFNEVIFTFHFNKEYIATDGNSISEIVAKNLSNQEGNRDTDNPVIQSRRPNQTSDNGGIYQDIQIEGYFANITCTNLNCSIKTETSGYNGPVANAVIESPNFTDAVVLDIADQKSQGNSIYLYHESAQTYLEITSVITTATSVPPALLLGFTGNAAAELGQIITQYGDIGGKGLDNLRIICVEYVSKNNYTDIPEDIVFPVKGELVQYTLIYNEQLQAFTSFYDHYPRHYFSNGRKIFSQDPINNDIYVHDEGNKGEFYGESFDSEIELLINPPGNHTKVFTNTEYLSQVYDQNNNNVVEETINGVRYFNEYQDTGEISLVPEGNIKRRMRTWRMVIPRDNNARMRNPYLSQTIKFSNNFNKRIILHDIVTHYIDSPM